MNKVSMKLVGEDGNAFAILGRFQRAAKTAGWTESEIKKVVKDATSGDYNHLLATIMENVEEPFDEDENCDCEDDGLWGNEEEFER